MRRRTGLVATALCAVLVLAACSDGDDGGDDAATTATPTTTTSSPDPTSTTPTTSEPGEGETSEAPTTPTSEAVTRCRKPDVRVSVADLDSSAGRRYAEVVLTNATGSPCRVEGYGGLQLLDEARNPVPTRVVRLTRPAARPVVLEPGQSATSQISFSVVSTDADRPRGKCQPEASFALVTAPDETRSTRVPWNLGPVCDRGRVEQRAYQPVSG